MKLHIAVMFDEDEDHGSAEIVLANGETVVLDPTENGIGSVVVAFDGLDQIVIHTAQA